MCVRACTFTGSGEVSGLCTSFAHLLQINGKELKCYEPHCLLYIVHAVGYMLGAAGFLQGVSLTNLGLTATHFARLLYTSGCSMVPHTLQVRPEVSTTMKTVAN